MRLMNARHLMRMFVFDWPKTDSYFLASLVGETTNYGGGQIFLVSPFLESSGRKFGGLGGGF